MYNNVQSISRLQEQCSRTHVQCAMYICSGAYANNIKCMYTRGPVNIIDCSRIIGGIYTDIEVSYVDMN